jgi:hypothetical protein
MVDLERANKAASEHKQRKRKLIQKIRDLSKAEADESLDENDVQARLAGKWRDGRSRIGVGRGRKGTVKAVWGPGHNSRMNEKIK